MSTPPPRRVALVTGSSRRIGAAIVRRLVEVGCDVAIHHRSLGADADAEELAREAREAGARAAVVSADLVDPAAVRELARTVTDELGPVEVLVHNASVFHRTPLADATPDQVLRDVELFHAVHVRAPLVLTHALLPGLRQHGRGRVVALADVSLHAPRAGFAPYAASKAALVAACRSLSRELAPDVTVNLIAPGVILPPATTDDGPPVEALLARVPAGRLGTVEEVAEAVAFFVDGPSFVTGQTLAVAGGE